MIVRNPIRPMHVKPKTYWLPSVTIVALVLLASTLDFHDQMVAAQLAAENRTAMLAACLNGTLTLKGEDGSTVGCYKAETN